MVTQHILSLSYGKDSLACLGAIEKLGWPLDRIIHAEVWATDTIPADLPPMVEFKAKADEIIKRRWGIEVEHLCAVRNGEKLTYEKLFYHIPKRKGKGKFEENTAAGFPYQKGAWCNDRLKTNPLDAISHGGGYGATSMLKRAALRVPVHNRELVQKAQRRVLSSASLCRKGIGVPATSNAEFSRSPLAQGADTNIVQYLGIAADEPERIARHEKPGFKMPLVEIGWEEAYCRQWCEENDLLSPIYTSATRGGCWFCHNQGIDQLRQLRHNYPELWALLLKWDRDSPVSFHADGKTVHDFDLRFCAEDLGIVPTDRKFRWAMLTQDVRRRCKIFVLQSNLLEVIA